MLTYMFQKSRPGGRGDYLPFPSSFPSGHAASAFATATSLAYAYGYKAGIPAMLVATSISAARVSENAHWLSDVFAGAALGIFWARASYQARNDVSPVSWMPMPFEDGGILQFTMRY
jgi:membrane-associated phospholipid phosphatase